MNYLLQLNSFVNNQEFIISGSKSETNRLLLLQKLFPDLKIENASDADDSLLMQHCFNSDNSIKNVQHAGTALRFLLSYYALIDDKEVLLTGSDRMKQRPIKPLVDALQELGAHVTYLEHDGFPPLKIKGVKTFKNEVEIDANTSSQYLSSLLLIAAALPNGLKLKIKGFVTSKPYVEMTLQILNTLGIRTLFKEDVIQVFPLHRLKVNKFVVESDWSSASYFYSLMALAPVGSNVSLRNFKKNSLQADASITEIYKDFGVETVFNFPFIQLKKVTDKRPDFLEYNLIDSPDIAQTLAVTCLGLGVKCLLKGLHTLKVKETDRLQALKNEFEKFGAFVTISDDNFELHNQVVFSEKVIEIETYQDHRMAMSFAPLVFKQVLLIYEAQVVSKSYPSFWKDFQTLGVEINRV